MTPLDGFSASAISCKRSNSYSTNERNATQRSSIGVTSACTRIIETEMSTNQIVSKVWSFCNTLRDDGVGYGDYLEQLT